MAAEIVSMILNDGLLRGAPVGVETVLSTDKYKSLVEKVVTAGGYFGLIYVALSSPDLACQRVKRRVLAGGHSVPEEKVHSRGTGPWQT